MSVIRRVFLLLPTLFISGYQFSIISEKFVSKLACKDQILHDFERYSTFSVQGNLNCATRCSEDENCISYNYLKVTKQCHLNKGIIVDTCRNSQFHPNSIYLQKTEYTCLHDGTWNSSTSTCSCVGGYIGGHCERLMTDCGDGLSHYSGIRGFFYIFPQKSPEPFEIRCTMMWGGRNILMQHYDPTKYFNRSWQEYKDGFSDELKENFWLGLDKVHYLTESSRKKVYIELTDPTQSHVRNRYDDFKIGNETTGYRLISLGSITTNELPECLTDMVGSKFSTFDNDQDQNSQNCAAVYGAGFWYQSTQCSTCNLFGQFNYPSGGTWNLDKSYVHWTGKSWSPPGVKFWIQNYY